MKIFPAMFLVVLLALSSSGGVEFVADPASEQLSAYGSVLWTLAYDNYLSDVTNHVNRLMTIHPQERGASVTNYTDGQWLVTSIAVTEKEQSAYLQYVTFYNMWVIAEIDKLVRQQDYSEAEKRLLLLDHFSPVKHETRIVARLYHLRKMISGDRAAVVSYKQIADAEKWVGAPILQSCASNAITAGNLLDVPISHLVASTEMKWEVQKGAVDSKSRRDTQSGSGSPIKE